VPELAAAADTDHLQDVPDPGAACEEEFAGTAGYLASDITEGALPRAVGVADRVIELVVCADRDYMQIGAYATAGDVMKLTRPAGHLASDGPETSLPRTVRVADRVIQLSIGPYTDNLHVVADASASGYSEPWWSA
jgi:hypothetical protein